MGKLLATTFNYDEKMIRKLVESGEHYGNKVSEWKKKLFQNGFSSLEKGTTLALLCGTKFLWVLIFAILWIFSWSSSWEKNFPQKIFSAKIYSNVEIKYKHCLLHVIMLVPTYLNLPFCPETKHSELRQWTCSWYITSIQL